MTPPPLSSSWWFLSILFLGTSVLVLFDSSHAVPMKTTISRNSKECLYDYVEKDDKVTVSAFILQGSALKGTISLQGPLPGVVGPDATTLDIYEAAQKRHSKLPLTYEETIDWEHLYDRIDEVMEDDDEKEDSDDEEQVAPLDPHDKDFKAKRKAQRMKQQAKEQARRARLAEYKKKQMAVAKSEGEPVLYTTSVPLSGYYQMCLEPYENEIVAELDMRKESDLGDLDEDGHVVTYEELADNRENSELDKDTASQEGIPDEEFDETKERLKELRRLLTDIQSLQQRSRRRITVNGETAEHSHSRMVFNSLVETIFFMMITGYQVYTIRKWFSGGPTLG